MNRDSYYRDHWVEIDEHRLENYEAMFEWHPRMAPLLESANLEAGLNVVDYGCGPGGLSMELARRVGANGQVLGLDLNADMVVLAHERVAREAPAADVRFEQIENDRIPLDDNTADCVICKSVLEYVTDPAANIAEFARVVKPGGRVHVIDSDWHMLVAEPLDDDTLTALFGAANHAYRTPRIGRRLYGLMRAAGLVDIDVRVLAAPDTRGVRAPILLHMVGYAREAGTLAEDVLDAIEARIEAGLRDGRFLLILPQFVVSGILPAA
jgi:ubiquinone/menaquinone biosynthesis C-methylase UbiE